MCELVCVSRPVGSTRGRQCVHGACWTVSWCSATATSALHLHSRTRRSRSTHVHSLYPRIFCGELIGPILWGHSGPLCYALSLSLSSLLLWTSIRRRRATVATPGEWQCKTGGVRRLAVANGPNIFQMFLVKLINFN